MYIQSSKLVFSPSDLTQFMESPFASWMEHLALTNPELLPEPDERDALGEVLQDKGNQHERDVLAGFQQQGLTIADLHDSDEPFQATREAMIKGIDVIYQPRLELLPFKGYADFLIKTEGASRFGDYHYELYDTKLSQSAKPSFLIQLCCYAEMLEVIQDRKPEYITVILGTKEYKRFRTADYYYFYQKLKEQFIATHQHFTLGNCPDPAASKSWGRWSNHAEHLLQQVDHLIQVATITSGQIKHLTKAGITTMTALANTHLKQVKGIKPDILERLKLQAKVQMQSEGKAIPEFQFIPQEPGKKQGLALLPPASGRDIFFDLEGFPLAEGGLEYLWGVTWLDEQGERQYTDYWAHHHEQEKESFRAFIEWAYQRWLDDPSMHIYHYAPYEISACRKLMGKYGVCEFEVDQLLRNEVFVDLYKVVKGSLIIGEPRYSIKNVEHLYRGKRETEVGSGGDSVVVYERWRENPDGDTWHTSKILNDIREYNIDDCNSTLELADWLRTHQTTLGITYLGKTEITEKEITEEVSETIKLRDALLTQAEQLSNEGHIEQARIHTVLAWSLEFHRRETKPVFWRMFDRLGLSEEELLHDIDCLAYCQRTNKPGYKPKPTARNLVYEYSFDPDQEFKGSANEYYILGKEYDDGKSVKATHHAIDSDLEHGLIALQLRSEINELITLIPDEYVNPGPIPGAIAKQAQDYFKGTLLQSALLDVLARTTPRIKYHPSGQPIAPSHNPQERMQQMIQAVTHLDKSYLTIQGPPGAGKTYTGKHLIAELIQRGKKIAISSNSHKAINNLLISTATYCEKEGIKGYFSCTRNTDSAIDVLNIEVLETKNIIDFIRPGCVVGATAWGLSRDELEYQFDYLFIDEAGQVSVANLIAMSRATDNIILMGDQMQLGQPSQGSHPEDSGLSILDYLLHDTPTIPDSMGVFLGTTYRMHSAVNHFISEAIYEGKLETAPANDNQRIRVLEHYHGPLNKEAGIVTIPVFHEGNTQASDEEVEQIVQLTRELLGRTFYTHDGRERILGWDDILFVSPYNHQVNKLKTVLGEQAKVGSVDKFQGQEAPVVFLTMCASSANESPRGLNFLFDKHRLNVAISRAQCLVVVVYSPALLDTVPNSIEQIAMINMFCRLTG
ncbi:TM0106 family RecB-like putative nuclease [Legionella bononiensis]|uniref:TM0106 family RecB-like putative nuclease n=1 Tax=Legionella bononiensis TaxID=2793102 RepID=A0ABS1WA08_9GAMM|nr:TM0106 family RecB-like putative nuclease [Legionella bononiensis]MBL7480572.1 TM0106 family RecB-like putative nuclease [Legionella bononiensis]MBL7526189.1 TM0106 family RecB-like putative nuclease [Legionella bononiensis]MBL7563316.1 TM0106 family RecB-like putative nuclease [Legionella bononiensis]